MGLVSRESPLGRAVLGKKAGDRVRVQVSDTMGYDAEIRSITKQSDDGSAPLMGY
jgi:transcription elongation factor GreA